MEGKDSDKCKRILQKSAAMNYTCTHSGLKVLLWFESGDPLIRVTGFLLPA
jgi:hypothetical protein